VTGGEVLRFLATVRFLKLRQISNRLARRFLSKNITPRAGVRRRSMAGQWMGAITVKSIALSGHARFLSVERPLDSPAIWNDPACSRLWLYQLHYFDGLAGAAAADGAAASAFIERWIRENPPAAGVGWEPFPVSMRICNWIKFSLQGGQLSQGAIDSLATQTAWLSRRLEFHLMGNHLLLNACALYCAGCFFDSDEAEAWCARGAQLLEEQLREQILPDGTHFELSAMYQLIMLEALLDVVNIAQAFDLHAPANLHDACRAMLTALDVVTHPDGGIAQFNDAALDEAAPPAELRAYARRLHLEYSARPSHVSAWLPHGGYARLCGDGAVALVDVAEIGPAYLPAHAHADTLTFELSVGGRRVIVDTGISTYEADVTRHRERGTAAHNTVSIDGLNSSDVWHAFRVGARARVLRRKFDATGDVTTVHAAHDGYRHIGVVHARTWVMHRERLEVRDEIAGGGSHRLDCAFHFHPDLRVEWRAGSAIVHHVDGMRVLRLEPDPGLSWHVADYDYHPGFGVSQRAARLHGRRDGPLPLKLSHTFYWSEAPAT